jgi:hypothetical protein
MAGRIVEHVLVDLAVLVERRQRAPIDRRGIPMCAITHNARKQFAWRRGDVRPCSAKF